MNVGLYQSASALSALERWQDTVSQNITSSQTAGYRKRTVNFSTQRAGELQPNPKARIGTEGAISMVFPKINSGINFQNGEIQPTRRELDCSIQGEGFFEVQRPDGSHVYTRSGEFRMRPDRTLVTSSGDEILSDAGAPILLVPNGGPVVINQNGSIFQGATSLGKFAVKKFADNSQLRPIAGGFFVPAPGSPAPETVDDPELLQGYLEASNVTPLREMVDLVLISRAYEANQKIINTVDQQMQKTLEALG
ncbi:MAG: flagellar hook-basal body protein [Verrucomicrobia bacterium]|nr:flagellar hook-basal body protein [Verrucomicrobiota bacterium]